MHKGQPCGPMGPRLQKEPACSAAAGAGDGATSLSLTPCLLCRSPHFSEWPSEGQTRGPWRIPWAGEAPVQWQSARPGMPPSALPFLFCLFSPFSPLTYGPLYRSPFNVSMALFLDTCSYLCSKAIKFQSSPTQIKGTLYIIFLLTIKTFSE